jgi:hypothetical protein
VNASELFEEERRGIAMISFIQYELVRFSILASRLLENLVTVHTLQSGCVAIPGMFGVLNLHPFKV